MHPLSNSPSLLDCRPMRQPGGRSARAAGSGRSSAPPVAQRVPQGAVAAPEVPPAILALVAGERDRLLLRTLWATGARVGDVLALRPRDIRRDAVLLPNPKDPQAPAATVSIGEAHASLPGELLLWAREHDLADDEPLFFSRQQAGDGRRRAITRQQAWQII